jgi:two-component system, LytTR family, response regulator
VEKLKKQFAEGGRPVFTGPAIQKIPCLHSAKIKLISPSEVEYVKSSESGVHVISSGGEYYTELTLQVLESRTSLMRCHKQYLINIDLVDEIILRENMLADIKTKSGRLVPVSRRYLRLLREKLNF